jgi:hypothetical protein
MLKECLSLSRRFITRYLSLYMHNPSGLEADAKKCTETSILLLHIKISNFIYLIFCVPLHTVLKLLTSKYSTLMRALC